MIAALRAANGVALVNMGRDSAAQPMLEQSQSLFDALNQSYFRIFTTVHLGNAELGLGNPEQARRLLETVLAEARALGDTWVLSFALNNLG